MWQFETSRCFVLEFFKICSFKASKYYIIQIPNINKWASYLLGGGAREGCNPEKMFRFQMEPPEGGGADRPRFGPKGSREAWLNDRSQ